MSAVRSRRWWFPLAALALGLSVPLGLEIGLRWSGRMAPPAPEIVGEHGPWRSARGQHVGPMLERTHVNGQVRVRTPRAEVQSRRMMDVEFNLRPTEDTVRVFTLGGSAALGVPVERTPARTFPGRLQAHLEGLGITAEVINLGGASFGSDHVRQLATEAADLGPAIFVVYSGNNEFFNYNMALWGANRDWQGMAAAYEDLHVQRLLRTLLGRPLPTAVPAARVQDEALRQRALVRDVLEHRIRAAGDAALPADLLTDHPRRRDPIYRAVLARYRDNLAAVAALGSRPGITVLLAPVPANYREPPWLSIHGPATALLGTRAGEAAWERATARLALQGCAAADDDLTHAIETSPLYAAARFERGQCRALTEPDQAHADLAAALELDMDPGRPPEAFREVVRSFADQPGVSIVDLDSLFGPGTDHGAAWFHDSCHLTADGQDHLAQVISGQVVDVLVQ